MEPQPRDGIDRIRVSDSEREQVVELLGQAAAEGRLTLDEYAERATAAHAAKTRGELAKLTDDLPVVRPRPAPSTALSTGALATGGPERLVAVFGNESRKGHWPVPEHLVAKSIFGDCHIELQDAQLQYPVTVIEATAIFGSVTIFVPEGVDVRLSGSAVFGSKESKLTGRPEPGAPVIDVRALVRFGSVTVRPPRRRWW
ncbi:DUF1707 SHOCT-like domain-containing protein [Micromonospora zhanjiangensis]|uniref:DUF1707 domain-containing protein n=1 Tax=Micromonospora zhanjiangensis TaxID=1522057 RepID=A0ABV8KX70_9ACTN